VQFGPKLRPVGWRGNGKKGGRRKSQNRYISPPRGGAISQPIFTKFGEFVGLTDVITPAKVGYKIFIGFSRPRGGKSNFSCRKQRAYLTVPCATALVCDRTSHIRRANMANMADAPMGPEWHLITSEGRVPVFVSGLVSPPQARVS